VGASTGGGATSWSYGGERRDGSGGKGEPKEEGRRKTMRQAHEEDVGGCVIGDSSCNRM
jgi:hypothetical protein